MSSSIREKLLDPPGGRICVVVDTDTYNEVDDQFALAYLLRSPGQVRIEAIYAAPFCNEKAATPKEGMEKSRDEIDRVLSLAGEEEYKQVVFSGADRFLPDENTPVLSDAAADLIRRARAHSADDPLYVLGIAAATDIASALLIAPDIACRIVVVWLGGCAFHRQGEAEFNWMEDYAAVQALFRSKVALVLAPCWGVAEHFTVSRAELERYLLDKNPLADFLARTVINEVETYASGTPWTKTLWDVTAAAWLVNRDGLFLKDRLVTTPIPRPDHTYTFPENGPMMRYIDRIERDALMADLFHKLTDR